MILMIINLYPIPQAPLLPSLTWEQGIYARFDRDDADQDCPANGEVVVLGKVLESMR